MAIIGRPFKPGNRGGPGRPKMDKELKKLKTKTRSDVEAIVLKLYGKNEEELKEVIDDKKTTFWFRHIARIILKGVAKGDHASFTVLSDYVFGKRAEKLEVTSVNQNINSALEISEMVKNPEILQDLILIEDKFKKIRDSE